MPLSFVQYVGDGATDMFNIPFSYLSQSHIEMKVDGVIDTSVSFPTSATVKTSSIPINGSVVEVRRNTPTDARIVDFQDGSLLGESDLDTSALQNFYVMQETYDDLLNKLGLGSTGKWDANSKVIQNVSDGMDANDAVTMGQVLGLITSGQNINFPSLTGDALKFFQVRSDETGYQHTFLGALALLNSISNSNIDADAVDGSKISDNVIDSEHYIDGSIDAVHLANDAVTTSKILDASITPAKLGSSVSLIKTGYRQTVLEGPVDAEGRADFITTGTGLQPLLTGSGVPIRMTFTDGYNDSGASDYMAKINYDSSFGLLPANNLSYLYGELSIGSGFVSLGSAEVQPVYGKRFPKEQFSLLHFEGSEASTAMTDEFGNIWTAFGNAQITTTDFKFGSSCLTLDGAGDYIQSPDVEVFGERWTIETWVKFSNANIGTLFESVSNSTFILNWDTNKLRLWMGDGYTFNIASALFSTTILNTAQWYHLALTYDGIDFKIYVDGIEDLNVAVPNSTSMANPKGLFVGIRNDAVSSPLNAKFDELRITTGSVRYGSNFTAPTVAFIPDLHWFNLTTFKMHYGAPNAWQIKQRLFLGEAETDATSVIDVRSYAYRGEATLVFDDLVGSTNYIQSHNIGTKEVTVDSYFEFVKAEDGYRSGDRIVDYYNYYTSTAYGIMHGLENHNEMFLRTAGTTGVITGHKFAAMGYGTEIGSLRLISNIRRAF